MKLVLDTVFHTGIDKVPEVRGSGKISVTFTPREFPTAARESTAPEEEEVSTFTECANGKMSTLPLLINTL